jgi:hypothetical protein
MFERPAVFEAGQINMSWGQAVVIRRSFLGKRRSSPLLQ